MDINQIVTFGDVRRMIIDTIVELKQGKCDVSRGMAIAANMKVLNDNIQVEINAAKMVLATEGKAHSFGRMVSMGQRMLSNGQSQDA